MHAVLTHNQAAVGDVLLLTPLGPGRIKAQLAKAESEVGVTAVLGMRACMRCWRVHASLWLQRELRGKLVQALGTLPALPSTPCRVYPVLAGGGTRPR